MNHVLTRYFFTVVAVLAATTSITADSSPAFGSHFYFVEEPVNPRSVAMGGSGTAYSTGGFSFYNPAAAANAESSFVAMNFGRQWGDLTNGSVETAWLFKKWFIGCSFYSGTIDYATSDITGVLGSASWQQSTATILGGLKKSRYSVGVAVNGLHLFTSDLNSFALSGSGGITALVLPGRLYAGAAVLHAGRYHKGFYNKSYTFHGDSMSTDIRGGVMYRDTVRQKLPFSISMDAVYSRATREFTIPVGIEVRPVNPLALRIGKRFNHYTDVFTCGLGLRWENLSFDASYVTTSEEGDFGMKWMMGLAYSISRKKASKT